MDHTKDGQGIDGELIDPNKNLEEALAELDALQGLSSVKAAVTRICKGIQAQKLLGEPPTIRRHFQFLGNPGTGKTTVARIMAKIFHSLGTLPTAKVVEVDRSMLVGQYVGQTPTLVNRCVDDAFGGVLFIDDASSLILGGDDKWGQEAVNTLLMRQEGDLGKFVTILADRPGSMESFIAENPHLNRHFCERFVFDDFNGDDFFAIFVALAKKNGVTLADGFEAALAKRMRLLHEDRNQALNNARSVRFLFERCLEKKAARGEALGQEETIFRVADLGPWTD